MVPQSLGHANPSSSIVNGAAPVIGVLPPSGTNEGERIIESLFWRDMGPMGVDRPAVDSPILRRRLANMMRSVTE